VKPAVDPKKLPGTRVPATAPGAICPPTGPGAIAPPGGETIAAGGAPSTQTAADAIRTANALLKRVFIHILLFNFVPFAVCASFPFKIKSGGGPPQSKTLARCLTTGGKREAFWSAPVLWRFEIGCRSTTTTFWFENRNED
jgi:hypothetical protein